MITLKFGGSSMRSADRILESVNILISRAETDRISVVVSAVGGVSNRLLDSITACVGAVKTAGAEKTAGGEKSSAYVEGIRETHEQICRDIKKSVPEFDCGAVNEKLNPLFAEYDRLLAAVNAFGECPLSVHCRIMGLGELLCAPIVEEVLRAKKQDVLLLDSRKFIFTGGHREEGDPDYEKTCAHLAPYCAKSAHILLFPGFVSTWEDGGMGLLGRNGSDFSAAIIGYALNASRVEFWTDVDGIYTADPRIVPDAILVDDMSYDEAMELSFFGSKVLHPKTLSPLAEKGIEAWSLNSYNPSARGTRIGKMEAADTVQFAGTVRGISCLKNTAIISVSGAGMKGRSGMAARIFNCVSGAGISVLFITQSSSEYTISFCVRQNQARTAAQALEREFELERRERLMNSVDVQEDCAIVSIVGDTMKQYRGVAATFFNALASSDINVLAIAQGSSERSISAVITGESGDTAVRVAHRFFFNTAQTIEVFIFGVGAIGGCLIDQIASRQADLAAQKIDIKVMAISRRTKMLVSTDTAGLDLTKWRDDLAAVPDPAKDANPATPLDAVLDIVRKIKPLNPVFVDCTASSELPERYLDILKAGMHIATPNKRANSLSLSSYRQLRTMANKMRRRFLYETNVGAGLPIIDTLQNLFKSGDRLTAFEGIMSGSLSYIFGRLDEGARFSEAVFEAREKQFTEPDPRDDLSGMDVARKTLIIAREAGFECELSDIALGRVFPLDFDDSGTTEEFLAKLPQVDGYFSDYIARLKREGKVLRMGASISRTETSDNTAGGGKCSVGILEVSADHPLYAVKGCENAFVFTTTRYRPIPLVIRGYGAGAAVTAAGVFGDILRTVSWNPQN